MSIFYHRLLFPKEEVSVHKVWVRVFHLHLPSLCVHLHDHSEIVSLHLSSLWSNYMSYKWWARVKNVWPGSSRVCCCCSGLAWSQPFLGWVWVGKFSLKTTNLFPLGSKKISLGQVKKCPKVKDGYCRLKVCSSRVRDHLYHHTLGSNKIWPGCFYKIRNL